MVDKADMVCGVLSVICRKGPLFSPSSSALHQANWPFILAEAMRNFPRIGDHDTMEAFGSWQFSIPRGSLQSGPR